MLIIKDKQFMVITRQNPNGGPALKGYPIEEDPQSGVLGYKIGYCPCSCQEALYIRTVDVRQVVDKFGLSMELYDKLFRKKESVRNRLIRLLGGKIGD